MDWQRTVSALLKKAENEAATPAERELFTNKAMKLMAKYGITELLEMPTSTPLVAEHLVLPLTNPYKSHRKSLIFGIARAMGCKAVHSGEHMYVFGLPKDLQRFSTLFVSLWLQALLSLASSEKPIGVHGKTHSHNYLLGFTDEVIRRAKASTQAARSESSAPSTALVLANREDAVATAVRNMFPKLVAGHGATATDYRSYNSGQHAGKRADIHQSRMGATSAQRALRT